MTKNIQILKTPQINVKFSLGELQILLQNLEILIDYQSTEGCNDWEVPATPENLEFMRQYNAKQSEEVNECDDDDDYDDEDKGVNLYLSNCETKILGNDSLITNYLMEKLESAISRSNTKNIIKNK